MGWYKGNLHTHTSELGSEGPAAPEAVVHWYAQHGYDWLSITDHNVLTELETEELILVRGQEVGKHMPGGNGPIHVNGFGISRSVEFVDLEEKVPTMQASIDGVLAAGGIASLNHPNDRGSFNHTHLLQTTGATLMEVFNGGGPGKNNEGGPGVPSCEEIWDNVLTSGRLIYGIATDDAHVYDEWRPDRSNPGRGWVFVWADELSEQSVITALKTGSFYASNGVTLASVEASPSKMSLVVACRICESYSITFSGNNGSVLSQTTGLEGTYTMSGEEGYVRATVSSSQGSKAWVQPVFVNAAT